MHRPRLAIAIALLGTALGAAACDSDPGPDGDGVAEVRVMHTRSDTPAIDLVVDGTPVHEGIGFAQASPFAEVSAGAASLAIAPAAGGSALATAAAQLEPGRRYTALFGGGDAGEILIARDTSSDVPLTPPPTSPGDTGAIPGESMIKLRVIHNAADAPPLDVYLSLDDTPIGAAAKIIEPFEYGVGLDPAFPGYFERDPGLWRVRFTADGTLDVLVDTGPISMAAGQVRSIILVESDTAGLGVAIVRER